MRVLIAGAKGMLAHDLIPTLRENHEVAAPGEQDFDITSKDKISWILREVFPDIVINCAAYTDVDKAEEERDKAFLINGLGVQNLALACRDSGIPLLHISTDYVFDGEKGKPYIPFDNTNPINSYGESKLAGEKYIQWISDKFYILRTSWLYGKGGKNFVSTILRLSNEKPEIKVVNDQTGSPTSAVSLSHAISNLISSGAYGIYHFTDDSAGGISWYDFAKEILMIAGSKTEVVPTTTDEFPRPAKRPRHAVLDTLSFRITTGHNPPDWKEALKKHLSVGA